MATPTLDVPDRTSRARRWGIGGLGLFSALTAILFVLAPVTQNVTSYEWPTGPGPQSTALPLFPYQPERLEASFSCPRPPDGLVLATTPPGGRTGDQLAGPELTVRAEGGSISTRVGPAEIASARVGQSCTWRIQVDGGGTLVELDGRQIGHTPQRPIVSGLFTDSPGNNLHVTVVADTRFDTEATALKIALGVLSGLSLIALLLLIHRREKSFARKAKLLPYRWWRPQPVDLVVTAVLAGWAVIGALTVDDGYIATMLKARAESGFVGNYFRWFNAPEAPFGWFYEVYRVFADISPNMLWLRLPSVLIGLLCWVLINRILLSRLTSRLRNRTRWACAAIFLLWYLPFDVGLRPEPLIVLGSLAVFALIERALATNAITPLAIGMVVAGATLAVTPTGIAAFLPFIAALGAIIRLLRRRGDLGWLLPLGVLLATGASALLLMFYDQTFSTVFEATRIRNEIGPSLEWQAEIERYRTLLDPTVVEGALNRRVPMLLMLFSMGALTAILLRRHIPGLAAGANRRLLIACALYLVALMFTPTKWTHHFGALAGFGVLIVAVLIHTVSLGALRSIRTRAVVLAVLAGVVALALASPNRWWYASGYNVPWGLENPSIAGFSISNLVLAGGLLLAVVGGVIGAWREAQGKSTGARAVRWLPAPSMLLVTITVAVVVLEVGTMAQAMASRWQTYTVGKANLTSFGDGECGMEGWLEAETDIGAGVLTTQPGSHPADLDSFQVNAGFPESVKPPAPFGTTPSHPVWGSYRPGTGKKTGTMTSAWFVVPPQASSAQAPPLVVAHAGTGEVELRVELAGADGQLLRSIDVTSDDMTRDTEGKWEHARVDPAATPGTALIRIVASDNDNGEGWLAASAPRFPQTVPTTQLVPTSEAVAVDWPNAFVLPCRRPAALANGVVEPVRYRFAAGIDEELSLMTFWPDAGGPYAPLVQLAKQHKLPTYLRGDKLREAAHLYRFDYPTPMRGLVTTHTTRQVGGLSDGLPRIGHGL